MRRLLLFLSAVLLISAAPTARPELRQEGFGKGLDYDLTRVRAAMRRGTEKVGPPPVEAAAYFADRPWHFAHAVEQVTLTHPDGSTFAAASIPIERGGGQQVGGHLITKGEDGWWRYGTREENGRIAATDAVVGRGEPPAATAATNVPDAFRQNLAQFTKHAEQIRQHLHTRNKTIAAEAAAAGEPVVFKIPALMLEINNTPFQADSTPERFEALYSGQATSPTGTLTELYLEQSFGHMVLEIDVYGVYTSGISMNPVNDCWYGSEGGPILGQILGQPTLGLGGYGAKGMALEAVPQADPEVDFSDYDQDGNGYVDFLLMIHSGPGNENTLDPCDVRSHYFDGLAPTVGAPSEPTPVTADGVAVGPVMTVPEIDAAIGVVAHEVMHALGEPDYYGTAGTIGTGDWDLGGGGPVGGIPYQTNPTHFNPVTKINFGWLQPRRVDTTALNQTLRPRASHPEVVQIPLRIAPAGSEGAALCDKNPVGIPHQNQAFYTADGDCLVEGLLIENLSRVSARSDRTACTFIPADFERQAYGSGLMVWHWDFESYEQLGNNNVLRPMLDIEEFDRRDEVQDLAVDNTRADPLDVFWGDPVGISGATPSPPSSPVSIPSPKGSPYTVIAPPATSALPTPSWVTPEAPEGVAMVVELHWATEDTDDWDLRVERKVGETWVEAGEAAGPPGNGGEVFTKALFAPGSEYRAVAHNYASASPAAEVTVSYKTVTGLGPAGTLNNDLEQTGWQLTNIRPADYRGLANATELPGEQITFDLIKHDHTTTDVSADFLRVEQELPAPLEPRERRTLTTNVYNHGGRAVEDATFALFDRDPAEGGKPLATVSRDLAAFERQTVEFAYTPREGLNELYVSASAPGDLVSGNNIVRTELVTSPAGAADVLIVDNDRFWTQEQTVEALLNALGVRYDLVEGEPSLTTLRRYDAAIWLTTGVSGPAGVFSERAIDTVQAWLDGGGKLWMASSRMPRYTAAEPPEPGHARPDFVASYLGLVPINNILNPMGTVQGLGDAIGGQRRIGISYIDGRPYLDYGRLPTAEDDHQTKGKVSPLFAHPQREAGKNLVGTKVEGRGFKTVWTFPPTMIRDAGQALQLAKEVLAFLEVPTGAPQPEQSRVAFNRFAYVQVGQDWPVTVGATAVDSAQIVYRVYGDAAWKTLDLQPVEPGLYGGIVPGSHVFNNGLEYYVQVRDGATVTPVDGGPQLPNVASAAYGTPAQVDFCARSTAVAPGGGQGPTARPDGPDLPAAGGAQPSLDGPATKAVPGQPGAPTTTPSKPPVVGDLEEARVLPVGTRSKG